MRILIVDDEAPARRRLRRMVERIEGLVVVGEACDGEDALVQAKESTPDLTLLDIQMPGLDGLATADDPSLGCVIFVTAHSEHAVTAFELNAVDYLLKPVTQQRLEQAITKARSAASTPEPDALRSVLQRALEGAAGRTIRLSARVGSTLHVFDAREITRITSRDKYAVFERGGEEYLLDESLNQLQVRLAPVDFVRVHRGELVNLDAVVAVHTEGGGAEVELRDGQRAAVSRRHLAELKARLGGG